MPSPDLTPYVDLTLNDKTAQELVDAAVGQAKTRLPGWVPVEGDTAVVLLESFALIASEGIFALNRVPSVVVQVLLSLFGITMDPGLPATATVTFACVSDGVPHTVPAGTRLLVDGPAGTLSAVTAQAVVLAAGATTVTAPITFVAFGDEPNGLPSNQLCQLVDSLAFVDRVVLASAPSGGRDPETSETYFARATQVFQRLVATYVLPVHFEAAALQDPAVYRAHALDNYDPGGAHATQPGLDPGHVTVAVLGPDGQPVSATTKANLLATLQAGALANLQVHLTDPSIDTVDLAVTVMPLPGYAPLATPAAPVLVALPSGGTLTAGTYSYAVTRLAAGGGETIPGATAQVTTTSTGGVQVNLPPGGGPFNVYGRSGATLQLLGSSVSGSYWVDTGAATGGPAAPAVDTSSPLVAEVAAAVRAFLSPMAWDWSGTVRYTKLVQVISTVPGVDFVTSLTPAADTDLAGVAPLAQVGALAVTVQARPVST